MKVRPLFAVASAIVITSLVPAPASAETKAKNVFLFISDGASWGTWDMASYYQYGAKGLQAYDSFDVKLGMTTIPLNTSNTPTYGAATPVTYDPSKAWDTTSIDNGNHFAGYDYIKQNFTDSAAAGTALASGEKTYNNAINFDDFANALNYVTLDAKDMGKTTGVVTSVPFTHATPAAFGAQNISRNNYGAISEAMIANSSLDLIFGAGDPRYDVNGNLRSTNNYGYMSETALNSLLDGSSGRTLIQTKADFEALADGSLTLTGPVMGLPEVYDTLQYNRSAAELGAGDTASGIALIDSVPTLETMTKGAINYASQDTDGFFLMIEGGAVDWGAHANNTGRTIEEQIDFNLSVQAAVDWINAYSSWDESLVIVLTDHGNGMTMGPNSDTIAFQPVQNNGQGVLPGVQWHFGNHTVENTLFWANGAGSELFYNYVVGIDDGFRDIIGHNDGSYIDNTAVSKAILAAMQGNQAGAVPEPATWAMMIMGFGLVGYSSRRRRTTVSA